MKISRILCPVDFSDASDHAIDQAVAFAKWQGARITALHVYQPMFMPVPGLPAPAERVEDAEIERSRQQLADRFAPAATADVPVEYLVETGQPADIIAAQAQSLPADVIVMGTHGSSGFRHLLLGSVAEHVLRKAACPVLTVPPRTHATSMLPLRHVLCAVDFSEWSLKGLAFARALAAEAHARLTMLHVIEWPWEEPPAPVFADLPGEQARALFEYRRYVESTASSRLCALAGDAQGITSAIRHGKSHAAILQLAAEEQSDLIVMGVHSRNALDLTLFGSTTNHVVRSATCPVLTLRK
jgi:nucleotide-binding universal stress UspA family protein